MTKGGSIIIRIYFALVSLITLIMLIISFQSFVRLGLNKYVFTEANTVSRYYELPCPEGKTEGECALSEEERMERQEKMERAQRQREASENIALLLVAGPLFFIHFRIVMKDWKAMRKKT